MFVFRKIWLALFSCKTCFEICPFALLPGKFRHKSLTQFSESNWPKRDSDSIRKGFFYSSVCISEKNFMSKAFLL